MSGVSFSAYYRLYIPNSPLVKSVIADEASSYPESLWYIQCETQDVSKPSHL